MSETVAVIGGGIVGSLIAREISVRSGQAEVTLIERDEVGGGASRRSAGLHLPRGATERVRRMSGESEDFYETLRRSQPQLPIYPLNMTVVAIRTGEARLREIYLDRAKLAQTGEAGHPAVVLPRAATAWTGAGCQYADVRSLCQLIIRDLRPRIRVREGIRVIGVEPDADGVTLSLATGRKPRFDRVVLAPGPWVGAPPWRELTGPLGVRVKRIVALHVQGVPGADAAAVVFQDEDAFLLPMVHRGHWLFSYTCPEWDVDPDAPPDGLTAAHLTQAREVLDRYAPALSSHATAGRVFCDAYSPDREPVVRALDSAGRVVFAGAANGSGYRLAPAIASAVADLFDVALPEGVQP